MSRWATGMVASITVVMAAVLGGCASSTRSIGVQLRPDETLEFWLPLCGDSTIEVVELRTTGANDEILWRIEADEDGSALPRVALGGEPDGFERQLTTSLAQLEADFADAELVVIASDLESVDELETRFRLSELPTDGTVWIPDGDPIDEATAAEVLGDQCSGPVNARNAALAAIAVVVVSFGAAFGIRRRSRT